MSFVSRRQAELIREGRGLPQFDETPIAMRMALLLPVIIAGIAAFEGNSLFESIRKSLPSAYSGGDHIGFVVMVVVPVVALLVIPSTLVTKRNYALVLAASYMAVLAITQQARAIVLP